MPARYNFSLLNTDYVVLNGSWNYKNVISPFYRLYLIDKGSGELSTPNEVVVLAPGFLYLIPSFTLFNQNCSDQLWQYYIHVTEESADGNSLFGACRKLFKIEATDTDLKSLKRIVALNPGRDLRKSDNPKIYEKAAVIREFLLRNNQLEMAALLETEGLILQLLARFMVREIFNQNTQTKISPKVPEAINYIATNLQEKLTVDTLAARANLSSDYFSKLFFRETGERPLSFIHRQRIERAQFLLITTDHPLAVIAIDTGFDDLSYFSRIFKKLTGHTPGNYKLIHSL